LGLHLAAGTALVLLAHGAFEAHPRPGAVTLRHLVVPPPAAPQTVPEPAPRKAGPVPWVATAAAPASPGPQPESPSPGPGPNPPPDAAAVEPGEQGSGEAPGPVNAPAGSLAPVVPPTVLGYDKPVYPARLRSLGVEGAVTLEIVVSAQGKPQDVRVTQSSGYREMDAQAVEALRRATYSPRTVGGTPEVGVLTLRVRYTLD